MNSSCIIVVGDASLIIFFYYVLMYLIVIVGVKPCGSETRSCSLSPEADFAVFVSRSDAVIFGVTCHTGEGVSGSFLIGGL